MKKGVFLLALVCLILSCSVCFAETQTVVSEGTYIMGDNDTPTQAEQAAIINAKRAALAQVGNLITATPTVDIGQLKADQIQALPIEVIKSDVLEKSKRYDGQALVYWVKIKSDVTMDNLSESISKVLKATDRKVIGVITVFDKNPPKHNDIVTGKVPQGEARKYNYADLEKDNNLLEPIKAAINEKYGTRYTAIEFVKDIPVDLPAYAKEKGYNYVILSNLKLSNIFYKTTFELFAMRYSWTIDGECTVKMYDADKENEIFNKVFTSHKKLDLAPTGPMGVSYGGYGVQNGFDACLVKLQNDIVWQMKETMPTI